MTRDELQHAMARQIMAEDYGGREYGFDPMGSVIAAHAEVKTQTWLMAFKRANSALVAAEQAGVLSL